jgi:hypothetical protein
MNETRTSARRLATALAAFACIAAASLPATALAASSHSTATPPGIRLCGTISGPHWSYKGKSGTSYIVYTRNHGDCGFALKWAPRLVAKRPNGKPGYEISGGPSGWVCANSAVHFGTCALKINGHPAASSKAFAWAGKFAG